MSHSQGWTKTLLWVWEVFALWWLLCSGLASLLHKGLKSKGRVALSKLGQVKICMFQWFLRKPAKGNCWLFFPSLKTLSFLNCFCCNSFWVQELPNGCSSCTALLICNLKSSWALILLSTGLEMNPKFFETRDLLTAISAWDCVENLK